MEERNILCCRYAAEQLTEGGRVLLFGWKTVNIHTAADGVSELILFLQIWRNINTNFLHSNYDLSKRAVVLE